MRVNWKLRERPRGTEDPLFANGGRVRRVPTRALQGRTRLARGAAVVQGLSGRLLLAALRGAGGGGNFKFSIYDFQFSIADSKLEIGNCKLKIKIASPLAYRPVNVPVSSG